jgi:hypothetical protein
MTSAVRGPARRWFVFVAGVLVAAAICLAAASLARAQSAAPSIGSATLQLWPEYDDPGVLVLFSGDFTDTASFPQEVAFPLPVGARGIQATEKQSDGRLISQTWQIENSRLTYTLPGPGFHIEYYVDRPPSGDQRDITYSFDVPYAIDSLEVRVQQPARSTGFSMLPPPTGSVIEADGLTYSSLQRTNLKAGEKLDLTFRYTKNDQAPSLPASAAIPTSPAAQTAVQQPLTSAPTRVANSWLPWLLIAIGLAALAAAALYWFLRVRSLPGPAPAARGTRPGRADERAPTTHGADTGATFCTQCGQRFRPEDRFCANCGAPR